jgi:glycosyltransferase involved in cell wall biosynthesis
VHDPELIPLAVLWRAVHRRPALFDAHEDLPKQVYGKPYLPGWARPVVAGAARQLERLADRGLDGVVVATPSIARNFRHTRVTLVQNFPWLRSFPEPRPLTSGDRAAVYIGAISEGRGLPQMLDAVGRSEPATQLVLAGPASAQTIARYLVAGQDHVDYRGVIAVEEIPALLAGARVGLVTLHPLRNYLQSQSTKIYEYMAAARPFVASSFPSWMEQLESFDCGVFVDPMDPQEISDAIQGLLSDDQRAREMGLRGRRALEEHFTFEAEGQRLVETTRLLLDAASHR